MWLVFPLKYWNEFPVLAHLFVLYAMWCNSCFDSFVYFFLLLSGFELWHCYLFVSKGLKIASNTEFRWGLGIIKRCEPAFHFNFYLHSNVLSPSHTAMILKHFHPTHPLLKIMLNGKNLFSPWMCFDDKLKGFGEVFFMYGTHTWKELIQILHIRKSIKLIYEMPNTSPKWQPIALHIMSFRLQNVL